MKDFSLFSEPWIPIVGNGRKSLEQLFTDSSIQVVGGCATEKIAVYKLLLGIAQCAYTPKDEQDWFELGPVGLAKAAIEYLRKHQDSFNLYGEKPFLQMPAVKKAAVKPLASIVPEIACGNTTVLTHNQVAGEFSDAEIAVSLLTLQSFAFSGKRTDNSVILTPGYQGKLNPKGKPSSGKSGPSLDFCGLLHSFVLGDNLWESLWLNLWTHEFLNQDKQKALFPCGIGTPPWECMPEGEDCTVARTYKESLLGRLVPLSRYCLIDGQELHLTEGIKYDGYKEGKFDPTSAVMFVPKPKTLWVDPEKRPWRELTSLLNRADDGKHFECLQLQVFDSHIPMLKRADPEKCVVFWSGGLRVSSNAGEQYVSGTDDYIESEVELPLLSFDEVWYVEFSNQMTKLDARAKQLYGSVLQYQKAMNMADNKTASLASNRFWIGCESLCQSLIDACNERDEDQLSKLDRQFYSIACNIYDELCPNSTARQMQAWVRFRPAMQLKNK